jgi:hypothetical protein
VGDAKTDEPHGMKVAITDASVFFDLLNTGVLPEFFSLDLEVFTTDFIYNEIAISEEREEFDVFLRSGQLTVITQMLHPYLPKCCILIYLFVALLFTKMLECYLQFSAHFAGLLIT